MSKIKDLTKDVSDLTVGLLTAATNQRNISDDLYASIKEVSELKYRTVELELRLSNLEAMVKLLTEKGGQ